MGKVEQHASESISCILIGNKCDLESQRAVSVEDGQELADHFNIKFMETSAKNSQNVEEAFLLMTKEIKSRVVIS